MSHNTKFTGIASSNKTIQRAPLIQVTQIHHPDDCDDDNDDVARPVERVIVPTIGIENAAFDIDNEENVDLPNSSGFAQRNQLIPVETNDMHTPLPTPLPFQRGNDSNIFVFDPDCASLYSRRGSYSIENVSSKFAPKFPRRSSYGQTVSDKSNLTVPTMRQIRNGDQVYDGSSNKPGYSENTIDGHIPPASPGMLSTNSAWSELIKIGTSRRSSDAGISDYSRSNSLSISNVSSSLSDHLRYLVRAFSSRTEKMKETTIQPPSPSSLSEYGSDALSAISAEPQVRHRLDSFFPEPPEGDTISEIVRIREEEEYHKTKKFKIPRWIRKLKFPHVIEPQSKLYLLWLFVVTLAFMYNAWAIPLRGVFPYQTADNVRYWLTLDYLSDFIYIVDILLFKMRVTFLNQGLKELDCLCLLPLDLFYLINMSVNPWFRLPRLLKIQTFWEFYSRCDHLVRSAHAVRIIKTMTYMLFLIHLETCGYYAMSVYEGIASNDWVYNGQGIAYIRCFYLATKTATSIGNNPKPVNTMEYTFMTVYWVSGVFVFALLIGQIRDIVDAANLVKTVYTQRMDCALNYLKNMNISKETQARVRIWFIFNWEQQKIIDERKLMDTLPMKLRKDLAIHVHFNTLSKVKLFQDCDKTLLYDLVLKLQPILYLPGDYVCKKGEIGKEMYIVSQGIVEVVGGPENSLVLATLKEGSVFGEISLLAMAADGNRRTADVRCKGFTNLFILSKADFESAMKDYPDAHSLLKKRAKRLLRLNARIERKSQCSMDLSKIKTETIIKTPPETPKMVKTVIQVMNPDCSVIKHLNTMSSESINLCTKENNTTTSNAIGKDNVAYEPGSEYNLSSKAAPTKEEVEAMFDEILTVRNWSDVTEDMKKEMMESMNETEGIANTDERINSQKKKESNSSSSSTDSGVQDTKTDSPAPSTTRTISNKDSKESFISTELGDILEDSECSDDQPTLEPAPGSINYTADMFGDIERKTEASDETDTETTERSVTTFSRNNAITSEYTNLFTNEYAQSFANGFEITIDSVEACRSISRNTESSPECKSDPTSNESNENKVKYAMAELRGNFEELISPDNTPRSTPLTDSKQTNIKSVNDSADELTDSKKKCKKKSNIDKKNKSSQRNKSGSNKHNQKQTLSTVSPYQKTAPPKAKISTNKIKATNKISDTKRTEIKVNPIHDTAKHENSISNVTEPFSSKHTNLTSNFIVEAETDACSMQLEQLNTRILNVAEANDSDTINNMKGTVSTIPVENKVTCFAEVHREKTLSPKLTGDDNLSVSAIFPETPSSRQRKISVISIGSVLKDGKETLV